VNQTSLRFVAADVADTRVEEILMAARHAFVEKGFDGASMQDLARAAGMSAGNFYRYFPSKTAIVDAMVARDLDEVEREFAAITQSADPLDALRSNLRNRIKVEECGKEFALWAEIMAAAARRPEVAAALSRMETQICRRLTQVFGVIVGVDDETAFARYNAQARLFFILVRSATVETRNKSSADSDLADLIMRTINGLVDDIVQDTSGETR
jgi:AcrR family transcriptional regulator